MAIDIFFGIMLIWGFIFGYVHGPIKVFLTLISVILSLLAAMRFTQLTAQLIRETFQTRSPYLPFLAFVITLVTVLFVGRILSKIIEEGFLKSARLSWIVQLISALLTSATFTFLFSVLVEFCIASEVINPAVAQKTSYSFAYVVKIPEYGKTVIVTVAPFAAEFIDYMRTSSQQMLNPLPATEEEWDNNNFNNNNINPALDTSRRDTQLVNFQPYMQPNDSLKNIDSLPSKPISTPDTNIKPNLNTNEKF